MDEADAGQIHTVIDGRAGRAVVGMLTGKTAIRDADECTAGGSVFHGGTLQRLMAGSDGGAYLGDAVTRSHPLG
jgi:hypothetical protein